MPAPDMVFPPDRTAWFKQARFGMFIHWGLYALLGRGEWVMNRERIPLDEYVKLADCFNPTDYDPKAWAALARDAGMRYMVLTTKHHEGFCLWDSKVCQFNATRSAAKRDLLAEYVEAVRDAGLKVGLYYSLGDWYHPDWSRAVQTGDVAAKARFADYTHDLVHELMTKYGRIDVLWYDLPQGFTAGEWRSVELNAKVRALQPHILINNRAMTTEDTATPEQHVSASKPGRLWEACMTLNENWGYCRTDRAYKSPSAVARHLATVASGEGNLLLNVGPDERGRIPEESEAILRRVGQWLSMHGEAIYDVHRHKLGWYLWGQTTVRGDTLYCHVRQWYGRELCIGGLTNKVLAAKLLCTGQDIVFGQRGPQLFLRNLPEEAPDDVMPVIRLDLDGPPDHDLSRVLGAADIHPDLPA